MVEWKDVVEFCNNHYADCYSCPIRGDCWEKRKDKRKPRTVKEYMEDMIRAFEALEEREKNGYGRGNKSMEQEV